MKAHAKKMHGTATPAHLEEEPKGMVVIDAYSVHRSPNLTRIFHSAQLGAKPADGTRPRIAIEFVSARCMGLYQVADLALNAPLKNVCARLYQIFLSGQVLEQHQADVAVCDISLNHTIRDRTPSIVGWALQALQHIKDTVDHVAVLGKLDYNRAFPDRYLQREEMTEIMGVPYDPEDGKTRFSPFGETFSDLGVDCTDLQEQFVQNDDE